MYGGKNQHGYPVGQGIYDMHGAGFGAAPYRDGVASGGHMNNPTVGISDIENIEMQYPLMYLSRNHMVDSGGFGKYRGGLGLQRIILVRGSKNLTTNYSPYHGIPGGWGLFGGYPAGIGGDKMRIDPDRPRGQVPQVALSGRPDLRSGVGQGECARSCRRSSACRCRKDASSSIRSWSVAATAIRSTAIPHSCCRICSIRRSRGRWRRRSTASSSTPPATRSTKRETAEAAQADAVGAPGNGQAGLAGQGARQALVQRSTGHAHPRMPRHRRATGTTFRSAAASAARISARRAATTRSATVYRVVPKDDLTELPPPEGRHSMGAYVEYFCPGCATLIDVEVACPSLEDDKVEPMWDISLDSETVRRVAANAGGMPAAAE